MAKQDSIHTPRRQFMAWMGGAAALAALPSIPVWAAQDSSAERAFPAIAFNHISYNAHALAPARDFYARLFGMHVAYDDGKNCSLEFGSPTNAMYIKTNKDPNGKARFDHFCFSIANFDSDAVHAELVRRGLTPKVDGKYSWAFRDPNGFNIHITAEHGVYPGQNAPGAPADYTGPVPPQPSGADHAPLQAEAAVLTIRSMDVAKSRDFYISLLAMKIVHESPEACLLSFGSAGDMLRIKKTDSPEGPAIVESVAFKVKHMKTSALSTLLKKQGLDPKPDPELGLAVLDPDGYTFGVLAEE